MYEINTPWVIWYHRINDKEWGNSSYKKLFTIHNLLDYKLAEKYIQKNHLQNSMLFVMRDDIFPRWEDPDNINGCCISFKIPSQNLDRDFFRALLACISEDIHKDDGMFHELNGISISPKKEFNIIKFWMRHKQPSYGSLLKEIKPILLNNNCLIRGNN